MANFLEDILEATKGEVIEAVLIPTKNNYYTDQKPSTAHLVGKLQTNWDAVKDAFNYEYDDGYSGMDCDDVKIWTKDKIYFIHEYDGSTCFHWEYRNPTQY